MIQITPDDFERAIYEAFGIHLPFWLLLLVVIFVVACLVFAARLLPHIIRQIRRSRMSRRMVDRDTAEFLNKRNKFVLQQRAEILRLNKRANWHRDYYIPLRAEIEVDPGYDLDSHRLGALSFFRRLARSISHTLLGESSKIEKDLLQAVLKQKSDAFLLIGDPGSGKTVSLRELFIDMADRCAKSNSESEVVPLYLDLKRLHVPTSGLSANSIHVWILHELRTGQDSTTHAFVDDNFERMLDRGLFFFLFDSFDEIPDIMDAQTEEVVQTYAEALERFIHATHGCRGLVASRPYRTPKVFVGQKLTIRRLSKTQIEDALRKQLHDDKWLATKSLERSAV